MNVAAFNQSSIPQTQGAINSAAKSKNELADTTIQQTTIGDNVELSEEGVAQSKQATATQGATAGSAATNDSSSSSAATIEELQEQIAALQEEIAALAAKAKTNEAAQAQLQAKQEELSTLNNELLQLQQNQQQQG